jgi:hypothetical protein
VNLRLVDYRPTQGRTIKALAAFKFMDLGLELRDVAYHEDNGRRWLVMPRAKFSKGGEVKYYYYALFPDRRDFQDFSQVALMAIEQFKNQREGQQDDAVNG